VNSSPYTAVLIIPTGIGAVIGGYAGDAIPVARVFSQVCDRLITHPNVLNGAQLYWPLDNLYYVEGYGLDRFARGDWGLASVRQNRIGLLFDRAIEPELLHRHLQAADATRATLGLSLTDYVLTDAPLNVELRQADSGASWGTIGNPDSLLRAAEKLIHQAGAEAIAIVARFPDDPDSLALANYRHGAGVDPLAGAEAVISHLIVRQFQIPAAHAPALSPLPLDLSLSPKAAAEEIGYTFLPCVLVGLSRAPRFLTRPSREGIWSDQVDALIVPASACGSSTVLSFCQEKTWLIAVEENHTRMRVEPETLGIKAIRVHSYREAIGTLVAHRAGISLESLTNRVSSLRCLS
jgi:Protein of unknown function (DUF3326)